MTKSSVARQALALIPCFALLLLTTAATTARADTTLWYNGSYDNRDSLINEAGVPINNGSGYTLQNALVYDNFVVPTGQTWTLSSVYSNDQMAYYVAATTATWQIRSGVSAGNGGTLVAGGTTAGATQVAVTPVGGYYYGDTEYKVTATIPTVTLTAGTYWLAVSPNSAGYYGDQSYVETTSGAGAIGTPPGNDGNSYITDTYPTAGAYNFTPTTTALAGDGDGPNIDFSMGVVGFTSSVPEPSSTALLAVGLIGAAVVTRYRKRAALAA